MDIALDPGQQIAAGRLGAGAFGALHRLAALGRYEAGECVYRSNDPSEHWYRVVRGAARKSSLSTDGRRHIVDFLLPGDFFGFGLAHARQFCVEVIHPATLIARYPRSDSEELADSNPEIGRCIRELAFDSIARLQRRLVILGRFRALEKVSAFLLEMADRNRPADDSMVNLPMSRYDIADYLGLAVETVSRALTELRDRHVIAFRGVRQVQLCDHNALEELADRLSKVRCNRSTVAGGPSGSRDPRPTDAQRLPGPLPAAHGAGIATEPLFRPPGSSRRAHFG